MSGDKDPVSGPPQPKFSRYRSVRHAKPVPEPEPEPLPEPLPEKKEGDLSRTKSMSRYRRSRIIPSKTDPVPTLQYPPLPEIPSALGMPAREGLRSVTDPLQQRAQNAPQPRIRETDEEKARRMVRDLQEKEARARRELKEIEEQRRIAEEKKAEAEAEKAKVEAELLAAQRRRDLERRQVEMDTITPSSTMSSTQTPRREKLGGMFSRKRSPTSKSPPTSNGSGGVSPQPSRSIEQPKGIEQGGGGIVPQTDAPISASNAGDRRVLVRCKQSSISLPVTPETTPKDIIYSAANIMTQNIIPSTAILLESYTHLGLERRIRRYEHIRDVMNSWDRDTQNALVIVNSDTPRFDTDLETKSVPRDPPPDVTVYMYHSQKPGKWNKRFITLMSTGQMFVSKKSGSKLGGKDVLSICHLSDFDIYNPTPQQIRKTLKPPKKLCYAIKSQQKTTMFLSTENFVHFFSTDDEELGEKFYYAIQRWRSWYLVNRMGSSKGKEPVKAKSQDFLGVGEIKDESPYTIGSFQPLLNMDRFNSPKEEEEDDDEDVPRQIPFHLRNSVSFPSRQESRRHPPPVTYRLPPEAEEEFASNSLLGRSYTERQQQQQGSHLSITNQTKERTLSMKSSKSMRAKPKPLLDFTPTFKEPPQWDKSGKGHGVKASAGKMLVDKASTPNEFSTMEDLLPNTTMFRRPTEGGGARPVTGVARPKTGARGVDADGPFVKGGLLSGGNGVGK